MRKTCQEIYDARNQDWPTEEELLREISKTKLLVDLLLNPAEFQSCDEKGEHNETSLD